MGGGRQQTYVSEPKKRTGECCTPPHRLACDCQDPGVACSGALNRLACKQRRREDRAPRGRVAPVLERTGAALAIDANCAWGARNVSALARQLAGFGVKFIEQPLSPAEDARMPELLAASPLPIFADESCVMEEDVGRMPGRFSGLNIKLAKCGGLTPAMRMLKHARELGLRTMVGCMLESSVLISAGAVVAQQTDFADLDGAWLIRDDPFHGTRYESGILHADVLIAEGGAGMQWAA